MLGMFCGSNSTTNEEYKKAIKGRILLFIGIMVLGVITLIVAFLGNKYLNLKISENTISLYSGFGIALIIMGLILVIKNISVLNNEEKLRNVRISSTDERNKEISQKASRIAFAFMLVTMYLVALISGLWYPEITQILFSIISLYLVVYVISYKAISRNI